MTQPRRIPLGPNSVLGRLANDPRIGFTGFSLGVLQLMHPAVSAGVIDHSDFFNDPFPCDEPALLAVTAADELRAALGPFVAGPDGVELFEVMMGDPRSFPADLASYEQFLADRGVEQLPNPPIDMPAWLEDTRS